MYTGEFDYFTLVIYFFVAIMGMMCIKWMIKTHSPIKVTVSNKFYWKFDYRKYDCLFILLFSLFATIRKVDVKLGGMDALNYKREFLDANTNSINMGLTTEFLYQIFEKSVRSITGNYRVFFFLIYFFIALSYIVFIKTYCKTDNVSAVPFVLVFFPFLKSFNTIQSSLAIAVFLLGLVLLKRKKILGSIVVISAFFVHRMSILYMMFIPFYMMYNKVIKRKKGIQLTLFVVILLIITYSMAIILRDQMLSLGWLSGTDSWYLRQSLGISIFSRWPMYIAHIFLGIMLISLSRKISSSSEMEFVKLLCVFDILATPVAIILGFWRANEYLYVARLIMWGHLLSIYCDQKPEKTKKFIKILSFVLFGLWLAFRIHSEWDDMKVMPYIIG